MLQIFKRLFSKKSQKSQERESILPRNRFADLDFERILKSGTRRLVDEQGRYAEDGTVTELEFPEDFAEFEFLVGFNTEEEEQFQQLLASLNSFDNAIQSHLESEMQQPIPQYAKNLGYTQKRWEKTFCFHPWILSGEENPPNLRYVADYVNDEFTVYFAKKHGRWRAYWDAECQKVIEESQLVFSQRVIVIIEKSKYHGIIGQQNGFPRLQDCLDLWG